MKKSVNRRTGSSGRVKSYLQVYGSGLVLALIVLLVAYQFVEPAPPYHLTIASASEDGAYHKFALQYKASLAKQGIELDVMSTSGSVENLTLLREGKVDGAFVQGGVGNSDEFPDLQGLASLYLEPLWIFTRKSEQFEKISDFAGKRLAVGPIGSGTRTVVLQLLADNGLDEMKVSLVPIGAHEGKDALAAGDIDAIFIVTQLETPIISECVSVPAFRLMNVKRAEAYSRLHNYLTHVTLPEGVMDIARNVPVRDIHLVAPSATFVIRENLHPALIDQLMQVIDTVHTEGSLLTDYGMFPKPENIDFPLSPEAKRYFENGPPLLQKYLPFWAATLVDRLKVMLLPLLALILPLAKVLPPVYTWRVRSRIYRWYEELHELEAAIKDYDTRMLGLEKLDYMEDEVRKVEVPLSYDQELYSLRLHIDMLRRQLSE
jgi:TRAP transporter TAXI family solute receptor